VAVLVTRAAPDNARTADVLQAHGFDVLLAPMLQFQAVPFRLDETARYSGIVVTSANALRAIEDHPLRERLKDTPLFAVGTRTADAARAQGFANVVAADGDVAALRALVATRVARRATAAPLLYLSAADITDDIAAGLAGRGITVTRQTVYRMAALDRVPPDIVAAFAAQRIEAVLHYSSRSARSFVAAIRSAGLEVAGLGVLQVCISDVVARILRESGAVRIASAATPQEPAMIAALERSLRR
jgi:uroporphyrinogen-III synthase